MAFEGESLIYVRTTVDGAIPAAAGTGPSPPFTLTVTTPGVHDLDDFPSPVDHDVVLELWGAGGGGANFGDGGPSGGGGGGGGYIRAVIPAATWATGGSFTIGAGGAAGVAEGDPGSVGGDSFLEIGVTEELSANGGAGGIATTGLGGAGGTVANAGGFDVQASAAGNVGGNGLNAPPYTPGAGGLAGAPPYGTGGVGKKFDPVVAGTAGANGGARLTFVPS